MEQRSGDLDSVRHALDRVLDSLQITPPRATDIRLALTEACTNAVQHAYPDASGPGQMVITFDVSSEALIVSVLDAGGGIDGQSGQPGLGVGLPVIETVADAVTVENLRPGTRVRMTFHR